MASRSGGLEPSPAAQHDWKPPSEFDKIKELNSQGGRLATVYGLLLTAYTFSAGSEPIRGFLVSIYTLRFDTVSALFMLDGVVAVGALILGFASALATMQPPVPAEDSEEAYLELRSSKLNSAGLSGDLVLVCLLALLAVWSTVAAVPTGDPGLDRLVLVAALLLTGFAIACAVAVLVRHRGLAPRLRPRH